MIRAIVPAYNESRRIEGVVLSLIPYVDEVIVVDDGSTDDTSLRAKKAGARVLTHPINMGQGAALETGQEYVRQQGGGIVVHFDGDGQFDPADILRAGELIRSGEYDMVLGSRFLRNSMHIPFFKRVMILPLARVVNYLFTGVRLTDAHNGFRVLGPRALEKIRITQNRMAHATEIIALIREHRVRYVEIPVTVTYHEYGQKMSGGIAIIRDLIVGKFIK
jgi:glycosyltransferase involved in cell wall biosynthesis